MQNSNIEGASHRGKIENTEKIVLITTFDSLVCA